MEDEDPPAPFWLSPWPFLEPRYPGPLPPTDDEDCPRPRSSPRTAVGERGRLSF